MLECLQNILGISESDCDCITQGLTDEQIASFRTSTSGLYMDQLEGGISLLGLSDADTCKSMYQMTMDARNNAIKRLEDDLVIAINNKYKKDKKNFSGQIGRMSFSQSLAVAQSWQGLNIKPVDYGDTLITIKRMQVVLNQSVPITIKLFRAPINTVIAEEIGSYDVTAVANQYTNVTLLAPLRLPAVVNGQMVEYYLAYDLTGLTAQPKDNTVVCLPCQGGVSGYSEFITANGVQFASPSNLSVKNIDNYSHGLILDVDIKCDNDKLFCDVYKEDDAIAVVMSYCVLYKANELLIEYVLSSPSISSITMQSREYNWGKRNHFRKEYEDRMQYLTMTIDVTGSGCYVCRETVNQPSLTNIFI